MTCIFPNAVQSVERPSTLLMLLPQDQTGWCEQFTQEGYSVIHVTYPPPPGVNFEHTLKDAEKQIFELGADWALLSYGLEGHHARVLVSLFALSLADLKACVHYVPISESGKGLRIHETETKSIPTVVHLAASQERLHAALQPYTSPDSMHLAPPISAMPPFVVFTYPMIPQSPPFPFMMKPPALVEAHKANTADPYVLSANNLAHTRTLEILKRNIGPHFNLEKLWERHTYYEFVERNPSKTMETMVPTPYVNHVATMTGGVGYNDLARFYKYHFTADKITPPDTELISVSRTVGADRVIDEMIYKCTHTTEIDYFLPGVPPTGKPLEIAMVGIIAFRGDKLFFEHLYWDQASVLVQLGLLDPKDLPVAGVEVPRKVLDPFGQPSNTLLAKWKESEGLSIE